MPVPTESTRPLLPPAVARGWPSVLAFMFGALSVGVLGSCIPLLASAAAVGQSASRTLIAGCLTTVALGACGLLGYVPFLARLGPLARESETTLAAIAFVVGFVAAGSSLLASLLGWMPSVLDWIGLPISTAVIAGGLGWWLLGRASERELITPHVTGAHCAMCGHDVQGLATDRCPECGALIPDAGGPWRRLAELTSRK